MEVANKQTIQAAVDAWRSGIGSPFDLLAADATWTIVGNAPISRTLNSKQEFIDAVIAPFNQRLSKPLRPTVRNIYADGDTVIALFDGEATARDGKPYKKPTRGSCNCATVRSSGLRPSSIRSSSPISGIGSCHAKSTDDDYGQGTRSRQKRVESSASRSPPLPIRQQLPLPQMRRRIKHAQIEPLPIKNKLRKRRIPRHPSQIQRRPRRQPRRILHRRRRRPA